MKSDNVKAIAYMQNERVIIEVIECSCGYHMGIDSTYLEQVDGITTWCPSCGEQIRYGYEKETIK